MTKVTDLEVNLEQFKIEQAPINSEAAKQRRALLQATIEKNKVEADRQFAEIIMLSKPYNHPPPFPPLSHALRKRVEKVIPVARCNYDAWTLFLLLNNKDPFVGVFKEKESGKSSVRQKGGSGMLKTKLLFVWAVLRCDNVLHLVVVQGLGSNYKRSGLEFYSTMILVVHLEPNILYGPFFEQRMTWDPGIT
ncbi:hypothetical protein Tco_0465162 [Tanacetum coccineum]